MSIRKRGKTWWVDFSFGGIRHRYHSPENSRNGARAYEILLKRKLTLGEKIDTAPELTNKKSIKFKDFAEKWFEAYVKINNKPSEVKSKKTILRAYLIPHFGSKPIAEINNLDIEEFKAKQLDRNLKPKSINNHIGTLGKCLRTAMDWELVDRVPLLKPLKVPPQKFDYLSESEASQLLKAASEPYYTAILIALHTGLRFGELIALSWEDIDFNSNTLTIQKSFSANILGSTKSNKIRYVPMTKELSDHLYPLEPKTGFILLNERNEFIKSNTARVALHAICEKAGLRNIGWHALRHSFASRLAEKGVTMLAIKELLGHSEIHTTMRYAHLGQHTLRQAIKTLEQPTKIELRHNSRHTCHNSVTSDKISVFESCIIKSD
jgi:integrase